MDKNKRLERLVEYYGNGNKSHFAKILGVKAQTINTWLSRNTYDTELIFAKCDNINASWLLTGEGNMLNNEEPKNNKMPNINYECVGTPYYNVDFIGGFDLIVNDQTVNPDFYINYPPYNKEGVVWCNLTGHSMEPEISNGDIIALREVNTPIQYLPAGEIYGIVTEEYRTIKRIRLSNREGYVRLIPSNKSEEYCEQEIPISMIIHVYAVLGSIRKFF